MALTPEIRTTQGLTRIAFASTATSLQIQQAMARTVMNFPADSVDVSQAAVRAVEKPYADIRLSQGLVRTIVKGRTDDPQVRTWTFSLDGHDFYVIRLGTNETLVYDLYTEQWYVWGSNDGDLWRAFTGINWPGGDRLADEYGSNVLVGDDGAGTLYFLDPTAYTDDDALSGSDLPRQYLREITGQVSVRGIDSLPCYGVQLIGSIGEQLESALTDVTLYTSDDKGHTWDEHDTITIDAEDYNERVEWWSLGSFNSPGRLFRVQDYGALPRIDFLEMMDDPDAEDD